MDYFKLKSQLLELDVNISDNQVEFNWALPTQANKGILTSSASFKLAKKLGKSPVEVANSLVESLEEQIDKTNLSQFKFEAEGPFINIYLSNQGLKQLLEASEPGFKLPTVDEKVMFEYIGANVAKRLHVGHMRNLNIGEALRRVLSLRYPNLVTDNHWGDWGVQFGVLIWAYKRELDEAAFEKDPMSELERLYVWGNAQEDKVENWSQEVRAEFKRLEAGDERNVELWKQFLQISKQELQHDLNLLNVPQTDLEQGESYYEDWMTQLVDFCDSNELWTKDDDARYVDFEQLAQQWQGLSSDRNKRIAKLGRAYFVSSQGYTTYVFRDVAARLQWADEHEIDQAITITDNRQQHNFNQAFSFIAYLARRPEFKEEWGDATANRLKLGNLEHVSYGYLSLPDREISSRSGDVLYLRDVFDAVRESVKSELNARELTVNQEKVDIITRAALKWKDLRTDPDTDIKLNPKEIVQFEGDTGVYQLYTYVRLQGILKNYPPTGSAEVDVSKLNQSEQQLIERTVALNEQLNIAAKTMNVTPFIHAVEDLTRSINVWYEHNRVSDAQPERQQALVKLVETLSETLASSLQIVGVDTLEEI